jgi:lactoylglutathione lyase
MMSTPMSSLSQTTNGYPPIHASSFLARSVVSSASQSSRPFKVLGLQQIAIGSLDKSSLSNLWCNIFGVQQIGNYKSQKENVDEDILLLGMPGSPFSVEVDLMMPIDPDVSPKVHVPPLNHIGLWVDNLPEAVKWMENNGVRFTPGGIRKGAAGHDVTFIHPKGNEQSPIGGGGVLIELVQAPKEVIEALS